MENGMISGAQGASRDIWLELRLSPAEYTAPSPASSASSVSSASSGSGSAGAGYGLGLIVPDRFSRERILRIMRSLCERDAMREKNKALSG